MEFLNRALSLEHPFAATYCPDEISRAIFKNLTEGRDAVASMRSEKFARWKKLADELKIKEDALCSSLHPDLQPFAAAKRPLLTLALLVEAGFPASDLVLDCLKETYDVSSGRFEYFGKRISPDMVRRWQSDTKRQIICQAELVAIPLALETWRDALTNRDLIAFIDNDPAREALVKGTSSADVSAVYANHCRLLCAQLGIAAWYARVASPSNISDMPSRGDFTLLQSAGACWRCPAALPCEPHLGLFAS